MAKIYEEHVLIKLSKLTKDGQSDPIVDKEIVAALEEVIQQLVGSNVIVELERA